MFRPASKKTWENWNLSQAPNYPHAKVIQFCLRTYPIESRGNMRVLDLGCGSGANSWFLAREGFVVTATDIAANAVEKTRDRLAADGLTCYGRVEPVTRISDLDGTYDLVICIGVLEAIGPELACEAVAEVHRVLKDRGKALFVFASTNDFRASAPKTSKMLFFYTRQSVERVFSRFSKCEIDKYQTTHEGGRKIQSDWFVKAERRFINSA